MAKGRKRVRQRGREREREREQQNVAEGKQNGDKRTKHLLSFPRNDAICEDQEQALNQVQDYDTNEPLTWSFRFRKLRNQ